MKSTRLVSYHTLRHYIDLDPNGARHLQSDNFFANWIKSKQKHTACILNIIFFLKKAMQLPEATAMSEWLVRYRTFSEPSLNLDLDLGLEINITYQ